MQNMSERLFDIASKLGPEYLGLVIFAGVVIGVLLYLRNAKDIKKKRELSRFVVPEMKKKKLKGADVKEFKYFSNLKKQIKRYYFFKPNKKAEERMYNLILFAEVLAFLFFLIMGKVFLAVIVPILIHQFAIKSIELATDDINLYVEQELPNAIKHVIKALTKTGDLKTVIYEAGRNIREPLRSKFIELSRKMATENPKDSILEFSDELDNTWIYAFGFLLTSYQDASRKRDIVENLASLALTIEQEAFVKQKGITEKKGVVSLNYILMGMSVVGFFLNLYLNDYAMFYFFETLTGMLILVAGLACLGFTVIVNLILSKRTL